MEAEFHKVLTASHTTKGCFGKAGNLHDQRLGLERSRAPFTKETFQVKNPDLDAVDNQSLSSEVLMATGHSVDLSEISVINPSAGLTR